MPITLSKDDVFNQIQSTFRASPTVLIGSGFSCAYGLPGMSQLGDHLATNVADKLVTLEAKELWNRHIDSIKFDLEGGLNNISPGAGGRTEIIKAIRELTAKLIISHTAIAEKKILNSSSLSDHAPARLLKKLIEGSPQNAECVSVITTNYDTLIELFCDIAQIQVDTGFMGFRHRWARTNVVFETSYKRLMTTSLKSGHGHYDYRPHLTVRLFKPHGSINWQPTELGPVEVFHLHTVGPTSIIVPGPSKYEDSLINRLFDSIRSEMNSALIRTKSLITIGFGFNDQHLQGAIEQRLQMHMPTIIITRDFTDNTKDIIARFPHVLAICASQEGAACHHNREIIGFSEPIWQLDSFLQTFVE